jgi:hypothetical protein
MKRVWLLAAMVASAGCAVVRVPGQLPSDPLVDGYSLSFKKPVAERAGPSDEELARAVQLTLRGRLAALFDACGDALELLQQASRVAPVYPTLEDWDEYLRLCEPEVAKERARRRGLVQGTPEPAPPTAMQERVGP